MSVSKKIAVSMSLVVCAAMTGCGGYVPTSEDISQARSLLQDLQIAAEQNPEATSADQVAVFAPIVEEAALDMAAQEELAQEETAQPEAETQVEEVLEREEIVAEVEAPAEVVEPTETAQTPSTATIAGQLTWEPAGYYEDGTVMSMDDISHYKIVFGTSKENLSESKDISVAGLLTHDFAATAGNTWFVGVKTVSVYGSVSDVSNLTEFNI